MAAREKGNLIAAEKRPEAQGKHQQQQAPAAHIEHHNTHHHPHHHHQPSARILHHWVHQFEKINASLDEHGQAIGQDRYGSRNNGSNGPSREGETNKNREGEDEEDEDEEAEEEEDNDELCFKATQLVTELLLMLFAASLLIIAAIVIFSKNMPAFMKSYEIVPSFLFLMCIVVATVSFARWLVLKVRTKVRTTFHPDASQLIAEQKLVLPDGIRPVGTPRRLVESIVSGPTSILVTVSNFRATASKNLVSSAPTTGAATAITCYNKSSYNSGSSGGGGRGGTHNPESTSSGHSSNFARGSSGSGYGNISTSTTTAATANSCIDGKHRLSLTKSNLINDSMTNTIDEESNSLTEFA